MLKTSQACQELPYLQRRKKHVQDFKKIPIPQLAICDCILLLLHV